MSCLQTVLALLLIATVSKAADHCDIKRFGPDDLILIGPMGAKSAKVKDVVRYRCQAGHVRSVGKLTMVCGSNGRFNNDWYPSCTATQLVTQDSNDVELIERPHTIEADFAYTSVGTRLAIHGEGIIKQWKFYSRQKGFVFFQVWRPIHHGGKYRFILVGQNQVETSGQGNETYNLDVADWIIVQPGDRIGLSEPKKYRGNIPYSSCSKDTHPEDFGVTKTFANRSDFHYSCPHTFSSDIECMEFSFKAVIHPSMSSPDKPHMPTSSVALVSRDKIGSSETLYLWETSIFYIPVDGCIKQWQFYAKHGGSGAFQVWRRVGDIGKRRYEFIGQNKVTISNDGTGLHKWNVTQKDRIAVKAGDIIGFLYGKTPLGIPYSSCNPDFHPESYTISYPLTSETTQKGHVYTFTPRDNPCQIFSFRAIVDQVCDRPDDEYTGDVAIVHRPSGGYFKTTYLGDSSNFYIPANGTVKEWQFFSYRAGHGAFQVWRRVDLKAKKYRLIGQNKVTLTSGRIGRYHIKVKEAERIAVKEGDIIGIHYGDRDFLHGVPYSFCYGEEKQKNKNVYWYWPAMPDDMKIGQVYTFGITWGPFVCRVFSVIAVIEQDRYEAS